jgi:hypothetical protein
MISREIPLHLFQSALQQLNLSSIAWRKLIHAGLFILIGCLEPYEPPAILDQIDLLVVEGFMDSQHGSVSVKLAKAIPLSSEEPTSPEQNAIVSIHEENGDDYTLSEQEPGIYTLAGLNLTANAKYRLAIRTSNQQEYASDPIELKQSPPIDSITWEYKEDGVNVLINTHDPSGKTRYYYWDFIETWEYNARHGSLYKVLNGLAVARTPAEMVYKCWATAPSTKVIVGSSIRLNEDVIQRLPLTFIPEGSDKISIKYSMLLKQRALSKAEFDFWQEIQKTTEGLGGLFDPQPFQVTGNIHHVKDPTVPVLGFFGGGSIEEKRIYIKYENLPFNLRDYARQFCPLDTVCVYRGPLNDRPCGIDLMSLGNSALLVAEVGSPTPWGFTMASPQCGDCRYAGGSLTRPAFWE